MSGTLAAFPATLLRACQDLLFPPACLGCRAPLPTSRLPLFCDHCREQWRWLNPPQCPVCGKPWPASKGGDHLCGPCRQHPPRFQRARAALLYQGPISQAILACKYQGELAGISSLAHIAGQSPAFGALQAALNGDHHDEPAFDYILPVPLHRKRLRQRGFNQALLLARAFFPRHQKLIRFDLLHRPRFTEPQTGMSGGRRRQNLQGAFAVATPAAIVNRRLLLVDDVFTTGTTVNECARVLHAAGAAGVEVFTLARVRE